MGVNWKKGGMRGAVTTGPMLLLVLLTGCADKPAPSLSGGLLFVTGDDTARGVSRSVGVSGRLLPDSPVPTGIEAGAGEAARETIGPISIRVAPGAASRREPRGAAEGARGRSPEFVPDEIVVKYRSGVEPDRLPRGALTRRYAAVASDRGVSRGATVLMKLSGTLAGPRTVEETRAATLSEIERIRAHPLVEYAEPNYIYRAFFTPIDEYYPRQWHYPLIRLPEVWGDIALEGVQDLSGITVAVIDTGVAGGTAGAHPDLIDDPSIFRNEYDFYMRDADAEDESASSHGTHVTGTIAALTNNVPGAWGNGVAGAAGGNLLDGRRGVRIMPLRALGDDGGTAYDIAQAILHAAGLQNAFTTPGFPRADVINLSLGGSGFSLALADAVRRAYEAGVLIVAASGNEDTNEPVYPAAYPEAISVAAVTMGAEKAYYSNFGSGVDIAAPGGSGIDSLRFDMDFDARDDDVFSTIFDGSDTYSYEAGTSMATPHVAGAAALVLKAIDLNASPAKPPRTPSSVKGILLSTAVDLGFTEFYGSGLLDVYSAVNEAIGRGSMPGERDTVLSASPKTVRLYGDPPRATFVVKNIGNGRTVALSGVTVLDRSDQFIEESSISATSAEIGPGGLLFTVEGYSGYADGLMHHARVLVEADGKYETVYVLYKHTGAVYVTLIDETMSDVVDYTAASPEEGFAFSLTAPGEGNYFLGASTDRDGDGVIFGDPGEAYGLYPSNGDPASLSLGNGDVLTGLTVQVVDWE